MVAASISTFGCSTDERYPSTTTTSPPPLSFALSFSPRAHPTPLHPLAASHHCTLNAARMVPNIYHGSLIYRVTDPPHTREPLNNTRPRSLIPEQASIVCQRVARPKRGGRVREAIFLANDGEEKSTLINRVSLTIYITLLLFPSFFFLASFYRPFFFTVHV